MNDADRKILPLLAGWLDGELTPDEARRVETALEHSAELRAVLEEWRSVDGMMPSNDPMRPEADWEALARRVEDAVAADVERAPAAQRETAAMQQEASSRTQQSWLDRGWAGSRRSSCLSSCPSSPSSCESSPGSLLWWPLRLPWT